MSTTLLGTFLSRIVAPASLAEIVRVPDLDLDDIGDGAAAGLVAGHDHARETVRAQQLPVLLIGDDDLLGVGSTYSLQALQTATQLLSRLLQAILELRLRRHASLFIRELLEHDGREEPPLRPVVRSGRTDRNGRRSCWSSAASGWRRSGWLEVAPRISPGKTVEFRVDIDPDSPTANPFTDYREVFFTLNGGSNTAGNSQTFATFLDTESDQTITTDPEFFRNPIDDKPTSIGLSFHAAYMGDHVRWFQTGNSTTAVPEPATIVLGALGAMGLLKLTGAILSATCSYTTLFIIAGCAYLVALTAMHLLVPRLAPAKLSAA